jgi:hypothetical protein
MHPAVLAPVWVIGGSWSAGVSVELSLVQEIAINDNSKKNIFFMILNFKLVNYYA